MQTKVEERSWALTRGKKDGNFIDIWYGQIKTKDPNSFSLIHRHAYQGVGIYAHHKTTKSGSIEPFFAWKNNLFHETVSEENLYYYGFRVYEKDYHGFHCAFTYSREDGDSHIGDEYDFQFQYNYSQKLDFQFIYAYFNTGVFVKNNVEDNDAQRLFL